MAISSHCLSPWESPPASEPARASSPVRSRIRSDAGGTRASQAAKVSRRGEGSAPQAATAMFSATDSEPMTWGDWNLRLTPWRANSQAFRPVQSRSSMVTEPSWQSCWPQSTSRRVDLPAPLGPIRQRNSGSSMVSVTSSRTLKYPKLLSTPEASNTAEPLPAAVAGATASSAGSRLRLGGRPAARSRLGTSPSGTRATAATKITPVARVQYCSHTSARVAEAKLMAKVPMTGPMIVPRPPTSVHSTTLVARAKPKIWGDTKPVRCT